MADSHGHPLHVLGDWSYDTISSNAIYKCLVSMRAPQDLYVRIMRAWQRELQFYAESFTWEVLCKNVKKIPVKKYQSFYILFINRAIWIYGLNSFGQCPFCHADAKVDFTHVFYACPKVQDIWQFVLMKLGKSDLSMVQILMGHGVSKTFLKCSVIFRD